MTALREALGIGKGEVVALVGAGGKTTALFRLAEEMLSIGGHPVITTTTKILVPEADPRRRVVVEADRQRLVAQITEAIADGIAPVAATAMTADGKLAGIPPEWAADLLGIPGVTQVLVEADGAARRPFKAPRDGEPVIPSVTTLVVAVVGIDALGQRVRDAAHRPEQVEAITGLGADDIVDVRAIARVLLDGRGAMRGAPAAARRVVIVNKADDATRLRDARALARELGDMRVVITALSRADAVVEVTGT